MPERRQQRHRDASGLPSPDPGRNTKRAHRSVRHKEQHLHGKHSPRQGRKSDVPVSDSLDIQEIIDRDPVRNGQRVVHLLSGHPDLGQGEGTARDRKRLYILRRQGERSLDWDIFLRGQLSVGDPKQDHLVPSWLCRERAVRGQVRESLDRNRERRAPLFRHQVFLPDGQRDKDTRQHPRFDAGRRQALDRNVLKRS